jgi:hypothetical protein
MTTSPLKVEDSRAQFESWYRQSYCFIGDDFEQCNGKYKIKTVRLMWEAWKFSRELLTVELPEQFYPDGDIECPKVVNVYQVIESIRAAGITVKGDSDEANANAS